MVRLFAAFSAKSCSVDTLQYETWTVWLWRPVVLGPPAIPAFFMIRRAARNIESKLALVGIGVASYGLVAFFWLAAIFWLFEDLFR